MRLGAGNLPQHGIWIARNNDAKALLAELGIMQELPHHLAGEGGLPPTDLLCMHEQHPTHWFVIVITHGCSSPAENGLTVVCCPKRRYSRAEAIRIGQGGAGTIPAEGKN